MSIPQRCLGMVGGSGSTFGIIWRLDSRPLLGVFLHHIKSSSMMPTSLALPKRTAWLHWRAAESAAGQEEQRGLTSVDLVVVYWFQQLLKEKGG